MQGTHDLKPVLHPGKAPCHFGTDRIRDQALRRGKGGKIVEHVVLPRQADLRGGQHSPLLSAALADKDAVTDKGPLLQRLPVGEAGDVRPGKALVIGRVRIVRIQDQAAVGCLMKQDLPLCVDVILKVLMLIQMVG